MKKTLIEELKRIHGLTYGEVSEGFLDDVWNKISGVIQPEKGNDPKKADDVSDNVGQFYNNLQTAIDSGGVSQQNKGQMNFQKEVESMQIGLELLGYPLPRFGVDGLFGPETAAAVQQFIAKNVLGKPQTQGALNENVTPVSNGDNQVIGTPGQGTHSASDWESGNAWDISGSPGSPVLSITNGVVTKLTKDRGYSQQSVKKIYGDQLIIHSDKGPDVFYTHISSTLGVGQRVQAGQEIGTIITSNGIPPHVHIGLSNGSLQDFANVSGGSQQAQPTNNLVKATPEMLTKEVEMLKQRGVTPEELSKYVNTVTTGGGVSFTDLDLNSEDGKQKYAKICQTFIDQHQPNPLGITGEMLLTGAVKAFTEYHKYVPPELALSQLALEGGIGNNNPNSRPVRTKNPFNVGNIDNGGNIYNDSVLNGIITYYVLIAKEYMGNGKTANDLVQNFVNKNGQRYATNVQYETTLNSYAAQANKIAREISQNTV